MLEVRNYDSKFELDQLVKLAKLSFNMGDKVRVNMAANRAAVLAQNLRTVNAAKNAAKIRGLAVRLRANHNRQR
jgi:hypothetical protein